MSSILDTTSLVTIPVHGGVVVVREMPGCLGHHDDPVVAAEDVTHGSEAIQVTAQCDDGPLGVLHAWVTHRPLDHTSSLAGAPKISIAFDEEADHRVLDLAGARALQADIREWLTGFDQLVDTLAAAQAALGDH